jgi:hypothetical protein
MQRTCLIKGTSRARNIPWSVDHTTARANLFVNAERIADKIKALIDETKTKGGDA